jgi:arylsulfatase A-like enzyme
MKKTRIFLLAMGLIIVAIALARSTLVAEPARPNIIFILTDDLDIEYPDGSWIDHFPKLKSLLADEGTTFKNAFVSLSLCCPSRTSMLRGQYAHNTQIFTNAAPGGGFQKAHDEGLENATFATWLHDAGYRTILIGKYLNGYPGNLGAKYIAPGWDEWFSGEKNQYNQFNYTANDNGTIKTFGNAPEDYEQDVFRGKAVDFIRRAAQGGQSFFMWMPTYSPHQPATFAPRYADAFPDAKAPRPPTFNQEDVSQEPSWVQNRPLLTDTQIASLDALYQKRLKSMLAVEDTVEAIIETLQETNQLDNTYIFFSSDNGFHLGQHRLPAGKNTEFEEDLRVPLIVRGPGIPASRVLEHLTLNIDFAPTFAELAGVAIPDFVDGRSLVPLLRRRVPPVERWRKAFLLEHGFIQTGDVGRTPADVSNDVEPPDPFDLAVAQPQMPQPFQGLHTKDLVYVEYVTTGEREMYNLRNDPYEQTSLAATADPKLISRLGSWLNALRNCAGASCRAAEDKPPF